MAAADSTRLQQWYAWLGWWTLLNLPGFALAVFTWGVASTFYATIAIVFFCTLVFVGLRDADTPRSIPLRTALARILRVSFAAVFTLFSLTVLAQMVGAIWLLVVALMVGTAPPVRASILGARNYVTRPEPAPPRATVLPETSVDLDLADMTDFQLCCLWRHSFWDLAAAASAEERFEIVGQRQQILDELASRNSVALEAWLASDARASSSPERFFRDGDSGQPAAA